MNFDLEQYYNTQPTIDYPDPIEDEYQQELSEELFWEHQEELKQERRRK